MVASSRVRVSVAVPTEVEASMILPDRVAAVEINGATTRVEAEGRRRPRPGPIRPGRTEGGDTVAASRGPLAQLVAHLHDAQGVTGSSPVRPTKG